jgi:hypothetical protein
VKTLVSGLFVIRCFIPLSGKRRMEKMSANRFRMGGG